MNEDVVGVALERAIAIEMRDAIADLHRIMPREQMVPFDGDQSPGSKALEGKVVIVLRKDAVANFHDGVETTDDIRDLHDALLIEVGV